MKNKLLVLIAAVMAFTACDKLPLQRSYEYDPQPLDPHQGVTCWQYIESDPWKNLSIMKSAIEKCGLQDYYSQTGTKYTFILLDDTAFISYVFKDFEIGDISEADKDRLTNLLLFHIVKGEYDSYNGSLGYDPVHVLTLWQDVDAVMTIKLFDSEALSQKQQDKVTFMDQCGKSTVIKATTSDLIMTNGPAHIISNYCKYVK